MSIYRPKTKMAEPPKVCVKCGEISRTGHVSFWCVCLQKPLSKAKKLCKKLKDIREKALNEEERHGTGN
jgi:ribosomal protein L32